MYTHSPASPLPTRVCTVSAPSKHFKQRHLRSTVSGVLFSRNETKKKTQEQTAIFASSHSPSVGQGELFWVYLNSVLEDGGREPCALQRYWCGPAGMRCRSCRLHPLPLDVAELSPVQLRSPFGQHQLDTFCGCSLLCAF